MEQTRPEPYVCRECGQPAEEPPWVTANRNGYKPFIHCNINRVNFGKVSKCFSNLCERCRFYLAVTEYQPVGIGGRMERVVKSSLRKRSAGQLWGEHLRALLLAARAVDWVTGQQPSRSKLFDNLEMALKPFAGFCDSEEKKGA